ncbi:unnamed protein product [Phytophthora fragariaefolia]|uniref:Unnamed protein product n=1 Tax=Phytophthora fragariaefolia TaxID=1490495 RepID=A0A9W6XLM5_9STRA|nr:unnamed protein product [Phytophthora fragariaefolia]
MTNGSQIMRPHCGTKVKIRGNRHQGKPPPGETASGWRGYPENLPVTQKRSNEILSVAVAAVYSTCAHTRYTLNQGVKHLNISRFNTASLESSCVQPKCRTLLSTYLMSDNTIPFESHDYFIDWLFASVEYDI